MRAKLCRRQKSKLARPKTKSQKRWLRKHLLSGGSQNIHPVFETSIKSQENVDPSCVKKCSQHPSTASWDHLQSFRETINCQWNMHFTPLACTSTHFVHDLAGQACHDFHGSNMFHNFSRYFSKEWLKYISRESMFGSNPFPDTVSVLSISQNLFATN